MSASPFAGFTKAKLGSTAPTDNKEEKQVVRRIRATKPDCYISCDLGTTWRTFPGIQCSGRTCRYSYFTRHQSTIIQISNGTPPKKSKLADPASNHYQNVGQQRQRVQHPRINNHVARKPVSAIVDEPINQQRWNLIRVKQDNIRKE
ncbi:hypothetical protein GCK72_025431 [Caenorhabditis remanei]|uniref:Uncharacterized protein n=1 Tax=Caenorhabditis remanei TaxID=31234 RepID=A0A6A5G2V6_CAERE|nr:hypothetical protein GCK72_025431 [Caenorhabditis remanei]KAF1748964.1 hypothetical protein GCK72_025431 [Caenorhabditis remanei]